MKKPANRFLIGLLLIAFLVAGCSNDQASKIQKLEEKTASEQFIFDEKGMQTADELIQAYLAYAESHKDNPETPFYLYKAADLLLNLNRSKESLDVYNKIIYQYPDFEKAPECLFLVAYIYENNFENYGKAKELYELFITKYPRHDFADDAAISIENMGKSPEELIRMFEEKNKNQQDTV